MRATDFALLALGFGADIHYISHGVEAVGGGWGAPVTDAAGEHGGGGVGEEEDRRE